MDFSKTYRIFMKVFNKKCTTFFSATLKFARLRRKLHAPGNPLPAEAGHFTSEKTLFISKPLPRSRIFAMLINWMVITMLNLALCDDEPFFLDALTAQLSTYLTKIQRTAAIRRFSSGRALLDSGGSFDLIFLDIQMPAPDGLETARLLRKQGCRSLLVFLTVLPERVFDAFEVEAHDYLVKPLDSAHFRRTMDRAFQIWEQRQPKVLVVRQGTACEVIPLRDIVYCEVQGRKLYLHKIDGTVTSYYHQLEDLERSVDRRFFKCHRSYLVNLDYVRGCQAGQVLLPQGDTIPVSRLRERELTQALLRHMKGGDF